MQLVKLENNEILLNSRLTELAFGKTSFASIISQKGLLAECDTFENGKYHFTFKDWSFDEVKALDVEDRDDRLVFFSGSGNGFTNKAATLLQIMDGDNKDQVFEAGFAICCLLTQAAMENIQIPLIGGGGIFMELDGNKTKVLFLPESLFKNAVAGLKAEDYADLFGSWVNQTIYDLPALCFFRGSIAYKMLTGGFAYPSADQLERNADILDRKFLPLELSVNGIDKTLATEVNKALKLNSNAVNIPGKKQKGKSSEDLTPTPDFPLELLYAAKSNTSETKLSEEEFKQKAEAYLKTQASKVNTKRKIRRNMTAIIAGFIAAIVLVIVTVNLVKTKRDEYFTKGITSTETVQSFLWAADEKDTVTLSGLVKGHDPQKVVDTISNIYVVSKQREAYSHDNGFGNLVSWLFYCEDAERMAKGGLYGIGLPKIDGKVVDLEVKAYKKNQNPEAITEENGITLNNKDISVHKVEYYLLHTEGEYNEIECDLVTQIYTLTFVKDRWYITSIETQSEPQEFSATAFKNDYLSALIRNNGDVVTAAEQIRMQYFWLPPKKVLEKEAARRRAIALNPFAGL